MPVDYTSDPSCLQFRTPGMGLLGILVASDGEYVIKFIDEFDSEGLWPWSDDEVRIVQVGKTYPKVGRNLVIYIGTDCHEIHVLKKCNPNVSNANMLTATPAVLSPPERNFTPPSPPPQTIPNFNPYLGLPRPSKIEKILQFVSIARRYKLCFRLKGNFRVYDFIFLIDDSGSMTVGSSWTEARESVNKLANWILDNEWDRNGITLRFLNSNHLFRFKDLNGISDRNKIRQLVNTVSPSSGTPTGQRCKEILDAHIDRLERAKSTPEYARIKPLILVVITDGQPTDKHDFALSNVLLSTAKKLADYRHHPNSISIQFVQVGGDSRATQALKVLTGLDTNGMVDAITSNDLGSLSPDKLGQLMLGGVHPNVRAREGTIE